MRNRIEVLREAQLVLAELEQSSREDGMTADFLSDDNRDLGSYEYGRAGEAADVACRALDTLILHLSLIKED